MFEFDGLVSQIVTNIEPPDGPGAFEVVIRADALPASSFIMSGPNNVNSINVNAAGSVIMQRYAGGLSSGAGDVILGKTTTIRGEWDSDVVGGGDMRLFINDVLMDTDTVGLTDTTSVQTIGSRITNVLFFEGVIANLKWWLTTADTSTAPEHDYAVDEGSGTTLNNDGTAGGTQTLTAGAGAWVLNP